MCSKVALYRKGFHMGGFGVVVDALYVVHTTKVDHHNVAFIILPELPYCSRRTPIGPFPGATVDCGR